MKYVYTKHIAIMLAAVVLSGVACGQNTKVKTITIVNGDTTITESNLDDELAKIEKDINITITDGGKSGTKIVKKIIINEGKEGDTGAIAYAYSIGDDKDADVEVTTDEKGNETKVIVKKKKGEEKEEGKTIVKRSVRINNDEMEKLNLDINVKNTTITVKIETASKTPLSISILDENGKQVFHDSQKDGSVYSKEIKLEKKGTYFLNLIQNKKSTSEKIIVE